MLPFPFNIEVRYSDGGFLLAGIDEFSYYSERGKMIFKYRLFQENKWIDLDRDGVEIYRIRVSFIHNGHTIYDWKSEECKRDEW